MRPDIRIQRFDPPDPWALVVRTTAREDDWVAYCENNGILSRDCVPTAIRYQGDIFRIEEVEQRTHGYVYRLMPWPDGEPWGRIEDLTAESMAERFRERQERQRMERMLQVSPWCGVFFGWLPRSIQEPLSQMLHFDTYDASLQNAVVECLAGMMAAVILWKNMYLLCWSIVLCFMGLLRFVHLFASDNSTCGLIPLELVDRMLRGLGCCLFGSKTKP
jgi:hypothetical protein